MKYETLTSERVNFRKISDLNEGKMYGKEICI